jgi:hypothetical protein
MDPRGVFSPIGKAPMYVCFLQDRSDPNLIEFHVMPGAPPENGFLFILGKPDISKCLGHDWMPDIMR